MHDQGFVQIKPSDYGQEQSTSQPREIHGDVPIARSQNAEVYLASVPPPEGSYSASSQSAQYSTASTSEGQANIHNYRLQPSEEIPQQYNVCNFEGGDPTNLQACSWVSTMSMGGTMTSYMPMSVNESASTGECNPYSVTSSEAQSNMHDFRLQPYEDNPQQYNVCSFEGGDSTNLQGCSWVSTMPKGDPMTSYIPVNVNESASTRELNPYLAQSLTGQYPGASLYPTFMNQTTNKGANAPISTNKNKRKKEEARKKEKADKKERKAKEKQEPRGPLKMKPACSSESRQLFYESGLSASVLVAQSRPSGEYYGLPQIEKQVGGIYSQRPPLQVDPQYYASQNTASRYCANASLWVQTQTPAMVQMLPYGFLPGMTLNSGLQPAVFKYQDVPKEDRLDVGGSKVSSATKHNKKKQHKRKMSVSSVAEPNSQDTSKKGGQQLSGDGICGSTTDHRRIDNKLQKKGKKKKGKSMDGNMQRAGQKVEKRLRHNNIEFDSHQGLVGNSSTAQTESGTFSVSISQARGWWTQACRCKQADSWLRKAVPVLWLRLVKGGACKVTHCCTFALKMVCGGKAVKKVILLLLHMAGRMVGLLHRLVRRILNLLWRFATSLSQLGLRMCRCTCTCSDKLIPNLTACISAPIRAILKCGIALISAPCGLLCSKNSGNFLLSL